MTTNIDRAAGIIAPWIEKEWGHPEDNAESAAAALADAGLLTPDLPERHAPAAVAEVIRLRRGIDEIRQFVERFPLVPPLVGTGSTEARAYEMQEKVRHALARILEGEV